MKKSNNKNKSPTSTRRVHFEAHYPHANAVFLAGTFNEWAANAIPMIALEQGRWAKDLALSPGCYEYCLVVDGQWRPDPLACESVPNPFGGVNSICRVKNGR